MSKFSKLFCVLALLIASSCSSYGGSYYGSHEENKETVHSTFWGLKKGESTLKGKKCNNGEVVKTESDNGFMNYLARLYTLGIYWPSTIKAECVKG